MRFKKYLSFLMCCILLSVVVFGCGKETNTEKLYVAVIAKSKESAFWKSVYSGVNAASNEYNLDFSFWGPDSEENVEEQTAYIEEAIEAGADAIVLSAIDYDGCAEAVDKAANAGIYVIVIDSDVNSGKISMRVSTDNYAAGESIGDIVLGLDKEKLNVGIVNFDVHSANGQEREKGFRDAVAGDERVNIVETINVESSIASSSSGTKSLVSEHPEINVIVTLNEWTTLGVGYAIHDLNLNGKVTVIGFDNNTAALGMLENGEIYALIVQNPFAMGYLSIEGAYNLINKNNISDTKIYTDTTVITKDNMYFEENQKILFSFDR